MFNSVKKYATSNVRATHLNWPCAWTEVLSLFCHR